MTRPSDKRKLVSKVNSTPIGLQSLLGNVNQGVNPHELDHKISPGVDLYPHWATRRLEHATAYNAISREAGIAITVPEGELWQPVAMSFSKGVLNAADDYVISVGLIAEPNSAASNGNYTRLAVQHQLDGGITAGDHVVGYGFGQRIILGGGWRLVGYVDGHVSATVTDCFLNVVYVKLTD